MDSNPFAVIIALLFCGCFQSALSECDSICGCDYQFSTLDVGGTGKEWSFPGEGIENCAAECSNRPGCTSFEYNYKGDEDYKCGTYTGGEDNMDGVRKGDGLNWQTCVSTKSPSTFTVLSIDHGKPFPNLMERGKYFNFIISDVDALLGRIDWDNEVFTIINHRFGGALKVRMWRSSYGGLKGDGHGRREPSEHASISDWNNGDILSFTDDGRTGNNDATYTHAIGLEAFYYAFGAMCDGEIIDTFINGLPEGPDSVHEFELSARVTTDGNILQGYVGYDVANSRIIMSFRGAANSENWETNFDTWPEPYPNAPGVDDAEIHPGFYEAFHDLEDAGLYDAIVDIFRRHPWSDVLCTGHSLGGALTSITALELRQSDKYKELEIGNIDVITFGMPRVFSPSLAVFFSDVVRTTWRIVNRYDIVASIPTKAMGYSHFGTEVWYQWQRAQSDRDPIAFKLCNGSGEDRACFGTDFWPDRPPISADHVEYFGLDRKAVCATERRRLGVSRLMNEENL